MPRLSETESEPFEPYTYRGEWIVYETGTCRESCDRGLLLGGPNQHLFRSKATDEVKSYGPCWCFRRNAGRG